MDESSDKLAVTIVPDVLEIDIWPLKLLSYVVDEYCTNVDS